MEIKFKILKGKAEMRTLYYLIDEFSFLMIPSEKSIDFELMINDIALTVAAGRVVDLDGYCSKKEWNNIDLIVPKYQQGNLYVIGNLRYGFANSIYFERQRVLFDEKTGWICIGNPAARKVAVEFVENCIAVIDDLGHLEALWLHPIMEYSIGVDLQQS